MEFIDYQDVLKATNKGLDIITMYYPDAANALQRRDKKFKIREERTASASIRLKEGSYHVTDFGGDQKERNGIGVCMLETNKTFYEAVQYLGTIFKVEGAPTWTEIKPIWTSRPLEANEKPKDYSLDIKGFTDEELFQLGPKVNESHCKDFGMVSLKSFTYCKKDEATITESTPEYPIYAFEQSEWAKVYQPKSFDKGFRFRFLGKKPKRHIYGWDLIKKEFERRKKRAEENYDPESGTKMEDPKLDYVFMVSGGSDGLNLRSFGYFPIWFNSESEQISFKELKELRTYAKEIIYIPDLDASGLKAALKLSLQYLDIKIMMLPNYLRLRRDKRGNSAKDFKDFVVHFYKDRESESFSARLTKIIKNAIPAQFWEEHYNSKGTKYVFKNTQFFNFLKLNGFGRLKDEHTKDGYKYIHVNNNIVREVLPVEISAFVHNFLRQREAPIGLRDLIYGQQMTSNKLNNIDEVDIEFSSADSKTQYFFFKNTALKITADDITLQRHENVDKRIWESKVIDHNVHLVDKHFKITNPGKINADIEIIKSDNMFFNFLINTSRVHWKKDLEDGLTDKGTKEKDEYLEKHKFDIAAPNLDKEEQLEQKQHLINKIYGLGHMLHTYKEEDKSWALYIMDNKLADIGESHGGSGKSLFQSAIQKILKNYHYIPGRDSKKTKDEFITNGITKNTDYILMDDCHQYTDYGFFYNWITAPLEVNNKGGLRFIIPYKDVGKLAFSSNFPPHNLDASLGRRLLYLVFSDYYHPNPEGEYNEERRVSDDFNGKKLFQDFDEKQWNMFFNFCAECVQFYLSHPKKINPPMNNVDMRNLMSVMGDTFKEWADEFFAKVGENDRPLHLDNYLPKQVAWDDFKKTGSKISTHSFKKRLEALCQYNSWEFNPDDCKGYSHETKRIMQKIDGKSQEVFFIRAYSKRAGEIIEQQTESKNKTGNGLDDELPF